MRLEILIDDFPNNSYGLLMFVAYYVWNVTDNVCISRTDDNALILYILVTSAFLEPNHAIGSFLKTFLIVASFGTNCTHSRKGFH